MIPTTSQNYNDIIQGPERKFLARLLLNGTELSCAIANLTIIKGSCGMLENFNVGDVIGSTLTAEVKGLETSIKGEDISVQIGLMVENETYEYITLGYFTVSEAKKTVYSTMITGYGFSISRTSGEFTSPQDKTPAEPLTLANIASEIATEMGCSVTFDSGIDTTMEYSMPMSGLTTYQALTALASGVGGYAVDTYDGNIRVKLYDDSPTHSVVAGLMRNLPEVEEQDFTVTGVQCLTPAGPVGDVDVNLITQSDWVNYDTFSSYVNNIVGYTYRPAVIDLTVGDPRIEGSDVLEVEDIDGSVYTVPCHQVTHRYSGGFSTKIVTAVATQLENDVATVAPLSGQIEQAQEEVREVSQYFWHSTTDSGAGAGAHVTEKPQADFLADPSNGGGNTLITSNGMQIRDGLDVMAEFSSVGVRIGRLDEQHVAIGQNTTQFYDAEGSMAMEIAPAGSTRTNVSGVFDGSFIPYAGISKHLSFTPMGDIKIDAYVDGYRLDRTTHWLYPTKHFNEDLLTLDGTQDSSVTADYFSATYIQSTNTVVLRYTGALTMELSSVPIDRTFFYEGQPKYYTLPKQPEANSNIRVRIAVPGIFGDQDIHEATFLVQRGVFETITLTGTNGTIKVQYNGWRQMAFTQSSAVPAQQAWGSIYYIDSFYDSYNVQEYNQGPSDTASISYETMDGSTSYLTFGSRVLGATNNPGAYSATFGDQLIASSEWQNVFGRYNIEDANDEYAVIVGNGTDDTTRANAFTVDWDGNTNISGDIHSKNIDGGFINSTSIPAKSYVDISQSFNKEFSSVPYVTATFVSLSTSSDIGSMNCTVTERTTTGFTLRIFNDSANTRAPGMNWIAIGF